MSTSGTKQELLEHLDRLTRAATPETVGSFTTMQIAADINVSRSLASQYLNELVRDGLIVKVNSRPVIYLHKAAFERFLQHGLHASEYPSMTALLKSVGVGEAKDFQKAIGHDLSLAPCIDQLKAAMSYPPCGLPVLLCGEHGCGKARLSRLAFEYCRNQGIVSSEAGYARLDCAAFASDLVGLKARLFGDASTPGILERVGGGCVFLDGVDSLGARQRDVVISLLGEYGRAVAGTQAKERARLILACSTPASASKASPFGRVVPIVVNVPSLSERSVSERIDLAMHFLRAEGRRVSANVRISRGALRSLVEANFAENVDGLKSCVINCCSHAYVPGSKDELIVRTYDLPANVLGASTAQKNDDVLLSCEKGSSGQADSSHRASMIEGLLKAFDRLEASAISFGEFISEAVGHVREYQDHLNFGGAAANPRALSCERVLNPVLEEVGSAHDVELTRKSSRLLAQCLTVQLRGNGIEQLRPDQVEKLGRLHATLSRHLRATAAIVDQLSAETRTALGAEPDQLCRIVMMLDINSSVVAKRNREYMGIICCHGYSTATSIADAANRILHAHVFDAVNMTYDQQVTDVLLPLRRLLERYSYCKGAVLLVDMGSLTDIASAISQATDMELIVVSNVSTGLALEVGSALRANESPEARLAEMAQLCAPAFSVTHASNHVDTVVFCSESGIEAADKIRRLFSESLPTDAPVELVVADYRELAEHGLADPAFQRGNVRAIVGTMDPGVEGIPFLALEDILYEGPTRRLDKAFSRCMDATALASFHASLLKHLTLQNVIESITILNPEKLYAEVSQAVSRLADLMGQPIAPAATIGLYVHLCCLVERLVTKTPIEAYANEQEFRTAHAAFIDAFRTSFSSITDHYRVEVPATEIAYVYDYISSKSATREHASGQVEGSSQQDE